MNKLFCKITGGHRYSDSNLRVEENIKNKTYCFSNWCTKCGEFYSYSIPFGDLFTRSEQELIGLIKESEDDK